MISVAALPLSAQRTPPAWTKGATCYEIFVRSFQDSNGDGIGDLKGLTSRLDYVKALGARCIWLMPVAESPSYHGYDVSDYYAVDREYGTAADFKAMMQAAHARGIRVLVDMVLNHSSDQHPYFQAALRDTASPYRAWYRFAKTPPVPREQWGGELWHKSPVRDEYYYGLFWKGMPDLNYETPAVRAEATKIARFWVDSMGVDGFRLDAVIFLVEEGTRVAHTAGTHAVLREYGASLERMRRPLYTIGEVWAPNDTLLTYYPDQLTGYFAFEVSDSLLAAVKRGTAGGMLAPALRLQRDVRPAERWSPFLRNHDQTRSMKVLGGDPARARLAATLLLTLPGLPYLYYGEEIGMTGDKPDERLRTPMQWTAGRGAGFTTGAPWERFADDSATVTVAAQERDPGSLLALNRRLIALRARHAALGTGTLVPLEANDPAVLVYARRAGRRVAIVIANLSERERGSVTLSSSAGALPAGVWTTRALVGSLAPTRVGVTSDGRVHGDARLPALAPRTAYVLELAPH